MKKEILFLLLLLTSGIVACDDGRIYDEDNHTTTKGSTVKITTIVSGTDKWPEGYSVVVAGFGDNDFAVISKEIPHAETNENAVSIVLSGISTEVGQIELCVINRLRKRIATFYKARFNAQTDTIFMDAGTIHAGMFNCIQENVFNAHCTACHGASTSAAAGLFLTPGESHSALVGIPAVKSPDKMLLVDPGSAEESFLHLLLNTELSKEWRIDHIEMITSPELLNLIDNWINDGAKD